MKHTVNETKRQPGQTKTPELDNKIRQRAYEIYQQRGRRDGSDLEDWVQAEIEVLGTDDIERIA